jgi:hypothetical protein
MDSAPHGCEAFDETIVFLGFFKDLCDPKQRGKVCLVTMVPFNDSISSSFGTAVISFDFMSVAI